ncbi:hypothetical protein PHMEG_00027225, partial [Phytophthora megakarya]
GCVRVPRGKSLRLTRTEKAALAPFVVSAESTTSDAEDEDMSFVQRIEKRRRLAEQEQPYVLLNSIPPTSNIVERFFSVARVKFVHEHNSLKPLTLEQILFLCQNSSYWDVHTVDSV